MKTYNQYILEKKKRKKKKGKKGKRNRRMFMLPYPYWGTGWYPYDGGGGVADGEMAGGE